MLAPPAGVLDDPKRTLMEYGFYLKYSYWSWQRIFWHFVNPLRGDWRGYHDYDGLSNYMGEFKDYPKNDPAPKFLTFTAANFSLPEVMKTTNMDVPFIVKGLAFDLMEKFTYDYVYETFDQGDFTFQTGKFESLLNVPDNNTTPEGGNIKWHKKPPMPFREGLREMNETKDLYIRFDFAMAKRNPELNEALKEAIGRVGPAFKNFVGEYDAMNTPCFLGMGDLAKTTQHQAVTDSWFFQVHGRKKWVVVPPVYSPYMKPVYTSIHAMGSILPLYKEAMGIPKLEVWVEPGDLFYFPGWWWHEVHNEGEFNLGCGVRPFKNLMRVFKSAAFPPATFPSHTLGTNLAVIPSVFKVLYDNIDLYSAIMGKFENFNYKNHENWWRHKNPTKKNGL